MTCTANYSVDRYAILEKRLEHQQQYVEQLLQMIADLQRYRFGRRSEEFCHPLQGQLPFDKIEPPTTDSSEELPITIASHQRKKNAKPPVELPKRTVIIPVAEKDKVCACGCQKCLMRYEVTERMHYKPCEFEILEEKREILVCPKECEKSITIAPVPLRILPKVAITESFLAHLIIAKFDDRQPLYHLEKKFHSRFGLDVSRQNMSRWIIDSAKPLMPLYNLLKDHIIDYDIASMDATTLQVLDEPNRKASTKSYAYCFRGGTEKKQVILYDYNEKEHQSYVVNWFEGFSGYIHSDADSFFIPLYAKDNVDSVLCHAHARRKFEAITKSTKKKGLAHHVMSVYQSLYRVERKARKEQMTPGQRCALRQKYALPILLKWKLWLEEHLPLVPPQSPIAKAMTYALKHWQGLIRYLEDGRLLIDNNHTEREIKPFVIARKNFLFAKSQAGARALCLHFSLIRTAKQHGLDPFKYYCRILSAIPHCQSVEDYEALLPWNIDLSESIPQA